MPIAFPKGDGKYAVLGCDGEVEVKVPEGFRALCSHEEVREEDQFYCAYKGYFIPMNQAGAGNKATAPDYGLVIRLTEVEATV